MKFFDIHCSNVAPGIPGDLWRRTAVAKRAMKVNKAIQNDKVVSTSKVVKLSFVSF